MALAIFSEDCICTSLCGAALGTFTLRNSECFRHALVVNTLAWKKDRTHGLLCWFVCHL